MNINSSTIESQRDRGEAVRAHFVIPLANADWPWVQCLKKEMPDVTFDYDLPGLRSVGLYQHRWQLWLKLPRLMANAFACARRQAALASPPQFFCVGSDVELLGAAVANVLTGHRLPLVLIGLIYTPRPRAWQNAFRRVLFGLLLGRARAVVVYSNHEVHKLSKLFGLRNTRFVAALYGNAVQYAEHAEAQVSRANTGPLQILAAGRSWRDYRLLCEAVINSPHHLTIVCDAHHALKDLPANERIKIVRNAYGRDYARLIAKADVVAVILQNMDISSGQMAMLDAMAHGKPVIVTRTPTTLEYGTHLRNCYFVAPDSTADIEAAMEWVRSNPAAAQQMGREANLHQNQRHGFPAMARNLSLALKSLQ